MFNLPTYQMRYYWYQYRFKGTSIVLLKGQSATADQLNTKILSLLRLILYEQQQKLLFSLEITINTVIILKTLGAQTSVKESFK